MELTSPQRAFLRSIARTAKPDVNVGKAGVTDSSLQHIRQILQRRELVKLHLLEAASEDRKKTAQDLSARLDAVLVDVVGRAVVLYRPNGDLPDNVRIQLPQK